MHTHGSQSFKGKKIAFFGSANSSEDQFYQNQVKQLGELLAPLDCEIYLGATTGLVGEFIAGVESNSDKRCTLQLVVYGDRRYMDTSAVDNVTVKPCYFTRLSVLTDCDVYIVLDGQLGTMVETLVSWNQLQARRAYERKIIVFGEQERKKLQFLLEEFVFSRQAYRDFLVFCDDAEQVHTELVEVLVGGVECDS